MMMSNLTLLEQTRARVFKTLNEGMHLNVSTEESRRLLRTNVNNKRNLITMFVDMDDSTQMSLSIPDNKFARLVQCYAQEVTVAALGYGGYVFKYEGDAVIVLFPANEDDAIACKNALKCSSAILEIIKVMNPIFGAHGLPEISVKIGLTYGHALIVLYGHDVEKDHIDIIGSSISLASKIVSIARPNQVLAGESIYNILRASEFIINLMEINLDQKTGNIFLVQTLKVCIAYMNI